MSGIATITPAPTGALPTADIAPTEIRIELAGPPQGKGRGKKKASDEQIARAYAELGNVWRVAELFGMCGQSVYERVVRLGIGKPIRTFSEADIERIQRDYHQYASTGRLGDLAAELGHHKSNLAHKARELGLTVRTRPKPYLADGTSVRQKEWIRKNGHPRGMLGKQHSKETKQRLSISSSEYRRLLSDDERSAITEKGMRTKLAKGTLVTTRPNASWKSGWREIGGISKYYRSSWEANYARYLQWLKERGQIAKWEHEPQTFWFIAIQRGARSYLPDFRVTEKNGSVSYHEVKGWMDDRSITKIKRMAKYHPQVKLVVVTAKAYRKIAAAMAPMLPGWE
jgi:hypothetical protein